MKNKIVSIVCILMGFIETNGQTTLQGSYKIVDTNQQKYYNNQHEISGPKKGEAFYGQDAQFAGNLPSYTDNGDGTITDNVTGLTWQKSFEVLSFAEATERVKTFSLGGYTDWRLPTIKEAYSLIMYSGVDASSRQMNKVPPLAKPFINTNYFDFEYGANGDRVIDTQMLSATIYTSTTMNGNPTVFGVNLADGRIKGYPIKTPRGEKKYTVRFVRGNPDYGQNQFADNGNGTISDLATGLMWQQTDSKKGMNWEEALAWAQQKNDENFLGYNDWRLPNAKELHSITDNKNAPKSTNKAAINPLFKISKIKDEGEGNNYPFFWTSTTLEGQRGGQEAVYICFGDALGFMASPRSNEKKLMDVHGAGALRSDPKTGDPAYYSQGRGPQGDVIRIYNYVRLVRDIE